MKNTKPKFTWKVIKVPTNKIKPTPNNFKLKTEEGLSKFNASVERYGRAGAVILNKDLTLINGNTNVEKAKELKEKFVYASVPNKQLTPREFLEFAAIFDEARAGQVDMLRIKKEIGDTRGFFKAFGITISQESLDNLAALEKAEGKIIPTSKATAKEQTQTNGTKPLTLLFSVKENEEFIKKAEGLFSKYKVDNVTDLVVKVFKKL